MMEFPEISSLQWYFDSGETDPYNGHKARIPDYPEWQVKKPWDGSQREMSVLYKGMHMGYVPWENLTKLREFIIDHSEKV